MTDQKLSILLVEDNPLFQNIMSDMLPSHELRIANNSKEALAKFSDTNPDIVFLDIALPDGNGQDLLIKMREIKKDAYIIMTTASRLREDVIKSMNEGAEGYIMKPFSEEMINEAIKEYIESC